jgi:hypothetical protein
MLSPQTLAPWLSTLANLGSPSNPGRAMNLGRAININFQQPVSDFVKFTGEDSKTTYEHVGQFLPQVSDFRITDVHNIRLFPLSLSSKAFNCFMSLLPNSIDTWEKLEQRFHEYFYNGESEPRLSHLVAVKQKYNESVFDYMMRFRDMRNKYYGLTIGERDLAELAFAGLGLALRDKMEGQELIKCCRGPWYMRIALRRAMPTSDAGIHV